MVWFWGKYFYPNVDACPGRLNQANLFIKRFGVFFGQCSEMCWRLDIFNSIEKILKMFILSINCFIVINYVLLWKLKLKQVSVIKFDILYNLTIKHPMNVFIGKILESSCTFNVMSHYRLWFKMVLHYFILKNLSCIQKVWFCRWLYQ